MTILEYYKDQIPEYTNTMYLDHYSPEQILMAARKKIKHQSEDSKDEQEDLYNI